MVSLALCYAEIIVSHALGYAEIYTCSYSCIALC